MCKPVPALPKQNYETIPDNQSFKRLQSNYENWFNEHHAKSETYVQKKGLIPFNPKCQVR